MAIYWPTQGFKGRTFELCVLTRWDFNFCIRSSPLPGGGERERERENSQYNRTTHTGRIAIIAMAAAAAPPTWGEQNWQFPVLQQTANNVHVTWHAGSLLTRTPLRISTVCWKQSLSTTLWCRWLVFCLFVWCCCCFVFICSSLPLS